MILIIPGTVVSQGKAIHQGSILSARCRCRCKVCGVVPRGSYQTRYRKFLWQRIQIFVTTTNTDLGLWYQPASVSPPNPNATHEKHTRQLCVPVVDNILLCCDRKCVRTNLASHLSRNSKATFVGSLLHSTQTHTSL